MYEIFLDTETTGLSISDDHRIVEIACIETNGLIPTNNVFHKIINPKRKVSDEALKIHGLTDEFLENKKTFKDIAEEFINFIEGKKLIIHNAPFDISFLNHELKKINKNIIDIEKVTDSLEIARSKFPGVSNSLDNLCKRFNIDLSRREKHNALLDCELLREVYINLTGQKEPVMSFQDSANNFEKSLINKNIEKDYSKIIIIPNQTEKKEHKNFLAKEIKKNYF